MKVNGADGLNSMAFSPDSTQLASTSLDGTVRLWDVSDTQTLPFLLANYSGHRFLAENVAYSPDGATLASASDDGTIGLWSTRGMILGGGAANASIALSFSPDGKTLAVSTKRAGQPVIALYSMPAQKLVAQLPVTGIAALAFSPDGKTLAVAPVNAPGDPVELWNVATHKMTGQFTTRLTTRVNSIAYSPDGTLLAVSAVQDTTMQVWSATRLTRVAAFSDTQETPYPPQFGGGVFMQAFSPDGRMLAVVGIDGVIRFYSVPGFSLLFAFKETDSTSSLAFSPNGRELALGNADGNVYLNAVPATYTDLKDQMKFLGAFSASTKDILAVEFLSNDSLLAAGSDSTVRFWNVPAGTFNTVTTPAQSIGSHWGQISAMSYSAQLGLIVTGSPSGSRVWETDPARFAANICATLKAPVRPVLWKEYLPDIPYTPVCG